MAGNRRFFSTPSRCTRNSNANERHRPGIDRAEVTGSAPTTRQEPGKTIPPVRTAEDDRCHVVTPALSSASRARLRECLGPGFDPERLDLGALVGSTVDQHVEVDVG